MGVVIPAHTDDPVTSRLVLTHLIPTDEGPSDEVWTQEAKRDFNGEVVLGDDLMEL